MKERVANVLLCQFVRVAMQGLLDDVLQQFAESGALLKMRTGNDSLDELPALIGLQVHHHWCVCDAHSGRGQELSDFSIERRDATTYFSRAKCLTRFFPKISIIVTDENPGDSPVKPFALGDICWMI